MADPTLLGFQITDEGGKKRNVVYPVVAGATLSQIQVFVDGHLDALDNVTGGKVTGAFVTFSLSLGGMAGGKPAALADHPVKHGGLLGWDVVGTKYRSSIFVPSYMRALIDANESIADAGDTGIYVDSILAGAAGVVISDLAGRALSSFLGGKSSDRK